MPIPVELLPAALVLIFLLAYALMGGADFGGGLWDLLATGKRAADQRNVISHALAPIWEANHVWLIVLIVMLWICYPAVYSAVSTALHIPLLIMLLGIVLRGSSFVFRSYGGGSERERRRWGLVFSITSIITPVMLGVVLGATATGALQIDAETGAVQTDFVSEWLAPFPFVTGLFALALFSFLAAVYLTMKTDDEELQEAFRLRALASGGALAALAIATFALSPSQAPPLYAGMSGAPWSIPSHVVTALSGVVALVLVFRRSYRAARVAAIAHVTLVVLDWGESVYPWMIPGQLTIVEAAAPPRVLWTTLIVMAIGTSILAPSFIYLYRVFRGRVVEE